MSTPHRATPEQWAELEAVAASCVSSPVRELRARVEALETDQLEQAESGRFCVDAIVRRVEALELAQRMQSGTLTSAEQAELGVVPVADMEAAVHRAAAEARTTAMAELRAASAEAQGFAILSWSGERQPCEECRYNHCIAETPFGRFLISWKGWKEHPAVTADETPFGDWFECWNSVEEAKSGCQSEYNRRLALVPLPQLQPELRAPTPEARPGGLVERVAEGIAAADDEGLTNMTWNYHARAAIREVAKWLRSEYPRREGYGTAWANLLQQEADRG